jgi:hypothetical protein
VVFRVYGLIVLSDMFPALSECTDNPVIDTFPQEPGSDDDIASVSFGNRCYVASLQQQL